MSSLFGMDQSNRLVFVSDVPRGLACQCRCVVCDEPLIARQGTVREHHFAHASGREPCDVSHESLLHQYAKQVIVEEGGLVVPMTAAVAGALSVEFSAGLTIAIEVAYSSFCDMLKIAHFEALDLPALEIDLGALTPEAFDPALVRAAVLDEIAAKVWLWPVATATPVSQTLPDEPPSKPRLPEEIITISGRWVSIREFQSGDIAVRVVSYDPDLVSMVKSIAKANSARYAPKYKSWNVPRWCAQVVRTQLRALAGEVSITLTLSDRHTL